MDIPSTPMSESFYNVSDSWNGNNKITTDAGQMNRNSLDE